MAEGVRLWEPPHRWQPAFRGEPWWVCLLLTGLWMTAMSGCRVGPDLPPPAPPALPNQFHSGGAAPPDSQKSLADWWASFQDDRLAGLIREADRGNLDMQASMWRVVQSRAQLAVVRGDLFPTGSAFGDLEYRKRSRSARPFVSVNGDPFNLATLGFDAAWEIDLFGKLRRQTAAAAADLRGIEAEAADVRRVVLAEIAERYVEVRMRQEQLVLTRRSLRRQQELIDYMRARRRAGLVMDLDVAEAQALWNRTASRAPQYRAAMEVALNGLSVLVGEAPGTSMHDRVGTGLLPEPPVVAAVGVPAELLRRRPDIRRAEAEVAAAAERIGVATAELYPQFSLLGTVGVAARTGVPLFQFDSLTFAVGPSVRWNILQFGRLTNNIAAQRAAYEQAVTRYRNTVLQAVMEVEDALIEWREESRRRRFLEAAVAAATKAVTLNRLRYEESLVNAQRVVDAERDLWRYEVALAESRGNQCRQAIRLYKALGGGWPAEPPGGSLEEVSPSAVDATKSEPGTP